MISFTRLRLTGAAKKTRIWAMGDFGEGTQRQLNVRNAFMNHVGSNYVDLWFWLGDNAYPGGLDQEYQKNLFNVYGSDRIMKQTPSYATPGNHDYANNNITGTERTDHRIAYFDVMSHFKNAEAGGVAFRKRRILFVQLWQHSRHQPGFIWVRTRVRELRFLGPTVRRLPG
jgi:hypothetical protein